MREPLPAFADVEITAADFTRAVPFRTSENSCYECLVAQAFKRTFRVAEARVGYDAAHLFPRADARARPGAWPCGATVYKWNDKRVSAAIVAFDAGDDARLAQLLPLTIHVQRVE